MALRTRMVRTETNRKDSITDTTGKHSSTDTSAEHSVTDTNGEHSSTAAVLTFVNAIIERELPEKKQTENLMVLHDKAQPCDSANPRL